MECVENSPLRLVIQVEESIIKEFIVADEVCVNVFIDETQQDNYFQNIYCLMASYNAWNIDYPKCYRMLRFFQCHVSVDHHKFYKTSKYKHAKKRYMFSELGPAV